MCDKAASISNAENAFQGAELWPVDQVRFLKITLFPVEISTQIKSFLMKKHVAVLEKRLEISWGISEAMQPDLKIQIARHMP
jgi:hypothetical protein